MPCLDLTAVYLMYAFLLLFHLQRSHDAFVTIVDENQTHIVCDINSPVRLILRDLVRECLRKF